MEPWCFHSVPHSSHPSCVPSSFSSRGSLPQFQFNSPDVFTLELLEDPEGTWSVKRGKIPGDLWRHCGSLGKEILKPYPMNQSAHQFNSIQSVPVNFGLWDTALKFLSPGPRSDVTDHLVVLGESLSCASFLLAHKIPLHTSLCCCYSFFYSIIFIKLKTQAHPGEQSTNNQQQRKRRNRSFVQMSIAIVTGCVCALLVTLQY